MKKDIASILCVVLLIINMTSVAYASGTTLKIDDASCSPGEIISIPITLFGNVGIAGAVVKITYDNNLELLSINHGDALSTLIYTPPAKLTSNPITLLWDGMEADTSNGVLVTLQFRTPNNSGTYNVSASYDVGGIYDGDMQDIDVAIDNGVITSGKEKSMSVTLTDVINVELQSTEEFDGNVYIALYGEGDLFIGGNVFTAQKTIVYEFENMSAGKYIKVFWWKDKTLTPYCKEVKIDLQMT